MSDNQLLALYNRLQGDRWRLEHRFSDDIRDANDLLHNPAAYDEEIFMMLANWCKVHQPCQFGRLAASKGRVHFCVLRETDITGWTDGDVAEHIAENVRIWKQRAAYDPSRAAHSFVLVACAPRIATAAPDSNLREFAEKLLQMSKWTVGSPSGRRRNVVSSDYLYLKNPTDQRFYGFQFNIDFFACAADQRWWHDHRFPGGIAFTANSTGHMIAHRDWYGSSRDGQREWALTQAMLTINQAATRVPTGGSIGGSPQTTVTGEGTLTWLRSLDDQGHPLVREVACPFSQIPKQLQGKDWTRYEGYIHTDHSIREEFFAGREVPPTAGRPYLMDFTYLYDERQPDFVDLTAGRVIDEHELLSVVGDPSTWSHRAGGGERTRSEEDAVRVAEQLSVCDRWIAPPSYAPIDQ